MNPNHIIAPYAVNKNNVSEKYIVYELCFILKTHGPQISVNYQMFHE